MVGSKYTRVAILIMFGVFGILFISSDENEIIHKKTLIQMDNVIEVVFEDFSKIKESMRYPWA